MNLFDGLLFSYHALFVPTFAKSFQDSILMLISWILVTRDITISSHWPH